jgi:ribosomal protein S18 acetylase RimI-like enzyme
VTEIAVAGAEEIDAILMLWGDLAAYHAGLDAAFTPSTQWRRSYAGYLATLVGRTDARVLVARSDDRLVGVGVSRITLLPPFFADRRRGFIQDVYTHPDYRRRGIARRLVEALLEWLGEQQVSTVELTVAVNNPEAIRLWERLGFHPYMLHFKRALP